VSAKTIAIIVGVIVWTVGSGFAGWKIRDSRATIAAQKVTIAQEEKQTAVVEGARMDDHANELHAARVEQQRIAETARTEVSFIKIEKEAQAYVQKNPDPIDCSLDADGLRTWREANSGSDSASAGPGNSPNAPGAVPRDTAATRQREPK